MSGVVEGTTYRSPLKKLVRFFRRSRDGWKRKCQEAKRKLKSFDVRLRVLRQNRDRWKELARQQQAELGRLREELEAVKSKSPSRSRPQRCPRSLPRRSCGTTFPQE